MPTPGMERPPQISTWYPRGKSFLRSNFHHGMYMCIPPTPSWLCGGTFSICGKYPTPSLPVESMRLRPTTPEEFARPLGNRDDFEFSRRRADSHALADTITALARMRVSERVFLSM